MKHRKIISVISGLLIGLFAYAAITKLLDYGMFRAQITKFPWIGSMAGLLSWAVPFTELMVVVLLLFPATNLYGLFVSFMLLLLFTVFLIAMLSFDKNLPCSCGGVIAKLSWKQHIVFNSAFILITVIGILLRKTKTGSCQRLSAAILV